MTEVKFSAKIEKAKKAIENSLLRQVVQIMQQLNKDVKAYIADWYTKWDLPKTKDGKNDAEATIAFMSQKIKSEFGLLSRLDALKAGINQIVLPYLVKRDKLIERYAVNMYQTGYYHNAYAIQQSIDRKIKFPLLKDKQIQTAIYNNPLSVFKSK